MPILIPRASVFHIKRGSQVCDLILHAVPYLRKIYWLNCEISIFKELFHRTVMVDAFYYIIVVMLNHQREQKLVYLLIVLNNLQLSHVFSSVNENNSCVLLHMLFLTGGQIETPKNFLRADKINRNQNCIYCDQSCTLALATPTPKQFSIRTWKSMRGTPWSP